MTRSAPRLRIYTSNRLRTLLRHFADSIAETPLPPARSETVVVQSQGMARWFHLRLAEWCGVAGGFDMPFPREFVHGLAERLIPRDEGASALSRNFTRDALTWRIFRHFETAADDAVFAEPARYFRDDPNGRRRLELAARCADLFDDYQLYRVELLETWARGADDRSPWQAELWRRLIAESPGEDLATRLRALEKRLRDPAAASLPERVTVFGIATLPPVFLDLLSGLSRHIPVSIYWISPTEGYWGDATRQRALDGDAEPIESNALLAALGKQGRDFFNLLLSTDTEGSALTPLAYDDPGEDTALHLLQSDVYHLRTRSEADKVLIADDDPSLQIHCCHSRLREIEVLRDRLLDLFERFPNLDPADVVVMVPNVEDYAAAVQAAFDREDGAPRIPYSIADRSSSAEHPSTQAIVKLLELVTSRVTAAAVLDLLDIECFRRAAEIAPDERPLLADWASRAGVRWGIDAEHRAGEFAAPPLEANTWRFAIDRMLMGRAAATDGDTILGTVPFEPAAANGDLLERFIAFVSRAFEHCRRLRAARPLGDWLEAIDAALAELALVGDSEEQDALARARSALSTAVECCGGELSDTAVDIEALTDHLRRSLDQDGFGSPFLTGRVTFCAMKPMRNIPFSVVCMAGLAEGSFPRSNRGSAIDLIAGDPRPGDRSARDDDRYLFLESMLAAEDALVLTYVGRSNKDNSKREPSTVLSALLDCAAETFRVPPASRDEAADGPSVASRLVVEHPLQPFSERYFDGREPELFSYAAARCEAAERRSAGRETEPAFVRELAAPETNREFLDLSIEQLLNFWRNPSRYFCQQTLGIQLPVAGDAEQEQEPVGVDPLTRARIGERLLSAPTQADLQVVLRSSAAGGELPPGLAGEVALAGLRREADAVLSGRVATTGSLDIAVDGPCWRITGSMERVGGDGLLFASLSGLRPWRRVAAWIHHLLLNAAAAADGSTHGRETTLVCRDGARTFESIDDPRTLLDDLVCGFREGLAHPLPFFDEASSAFVDATTGSRIKSRAAALEQAAVLWASTTSGPRGERREEPYCALAFRGQAALSDDPERFADWALRIFRPLLAAERRS